MTPGPPASYPVFSTPPELAAAIRQTGWRACDTASKHTLDQGQRGVDDTIRALNRGPTTGLIDSDVILLNFARTAAKGKTSQLRPGQRYCRTARIVPAPRR